MCALDVPLKGSTAAKKTHLLQVKRATGKVPAELILPKFPKELWYLVEWVRGLHREQHLTYTEVKAWAELLGTAPTPEEVEVLIRLDAIYHRVWADER